MRKLYRVVQVVLLLTVADVLGVSALRMRPPPR